MSEENVEIIEGLVHYNEDDALDAARLAG